MPAQRSGERGAAAAAPLGPGLPATTGAIPHRPERLDQSVHVGDEAIAGVRGEQVGQEAVHSGLVGVVGVGPGTATCHFSGGLGRERLELAEQRPAPVVAVGRWCQRFERPDTGAVS